MWEEGIDINSVCQIRTRTNLYFGVGAIDSIQEIALELAKRSIRCVLAVTGKSAYKRTGAWEKVEKALQENGIKCILYNGVTPNPTVDQVDLAATLGRNNGAGAVIAIGGGSALDAGKCAAALLANPGRNARELCSYAFVPETAVPIVAINLTHGTGSEVNRFAVVTIPEDNYKPVIASDALYPAWAIDDPALMTGLGADQTRFVSIDAINHVVEAATSRAASPFSVMMACETVRLVARYLPVAAKEPANLKARYFLLYASMIAGVAFDNSLLHYTHALEHPLSAVHPELTHGLGLSVLLPAVVKTIYPDCPKVLADVLAPISPGLRGEPDEAEKAGRAVEKWLFSVGVTQKLGDCGFSEEDVPSLVDLTKKTPSLTTLLEMAPTRATDEVIAAIYLTSMGPMVGTMI